MLRHHHHHQDHHCIANYHHHHQHHPHQDGAIHATECITVQLGFKSVDVPIHHQDHHCIANYHHLLWHHHHHQILYLCLIKNDISCWGTDYISVFFFSNTQLCIVIGQEVENFKNNLNWKFGFERCWCYKQNLPSPEFEVETLFWFWQNWKLFLYFCNCVCVFVYFCVSVFLYLSSPLYPEHGHWAATFNNFD